MISILLYIIGRYLSIITKSSACGTISCFKMTTEEMNIKSQPGQAGSSVQNLLINVEKRKLLFIL
jgi:hypothetical protein